MPGKMQLQEDVSVETCRITPTIKDKNLNYKVTVQPISVDNKISISSFAGTCDYERSVFCDEHHSHIITSGFKIITNSKLRSKGSNNGIQIPSVIVNVGLPLIPTLIIV